MPRDAGSRAGTTITQRLPYVCRSLFSANLRYQRWLGAEIGERIWANLLVLPAQPGRGSEGTGNCSSCYGAAISPLRYLQLGKQRVFAVEASATTKKVVVVTVTWMAEVRRPPSPKRLWQLCRKVGHSTSGTLVSLISLYFSYTWIHIWIHRSWNRWNVAYKFMIIKSYVNSWYEFIIWIHDHEKYREIIHQNLYMNSSKNSLCWIHIWNHIWIHTMDSSLNSVLWRISWNHGWIPINEFKYKIMVELGIH